MSNIPDENAFLAEHSAAVYNLSLRLVGNPSDAEDLAQDALLRALKALHGFRGESSLSTWVYRITVNTWKNRVRSEKRRGFWKTVSLALFSGEEQDEEPSFKADDPPLDAGLEKREKETMIQKALMKLDEESRAIIVLRDVEERPYREIAAILDIPEGTVKSRLSRAREALREKLRDRLVAP